MPHTSVFERRTVRSRLVTPEWEEAPRDAPTMAERTASFGGPQWLHEHTTLSGRCAMSHTLQAVCDTVVAHLADVSGGQARVAYMELLFKVDGDNRCGRLRFRTGGGEGGKSGQARVAYMELLFKVDGDNMCDCAHLCAGWGAGQAAKAHCADIELLVNI
eukprot:351427-Chlamydomonas_euryale.AAC.2